MKVWTISSDNVCVCVYANIPFPTFYVSQTNVPLAAKFEEHFGFYAVHRSTAVAVFFFSFYC